MATGSWWKEIEFSAQQVSLGVPTVWCCVHLPIVARCAGGRHLASRPEMSREVTAAKAMWMWGKYRHLTLASS